MNPPQHSFRILTAVSLAAIGMLLPGIVQAGTPAEHGIEGYMLRAAVERADSAGRSWTNPETPVAFKAPAPEPTPEPETSAPAPEPVVPPGGPVVEASCSDDKRYSNRQAGRFASAAEYCDWITRAASLEAEFFGKLPRNFFPEGGPAGWYVDRLDYMYWSPSYYTETHVELTGSTSIGYFNMDNVAELPPESYFYTPEKFLTAVQGVGGCRHGAGLFEVYGPGVWDGTCQLGSGPSIRVQADVGSIDIRFSWQLPR